MHQQEFDQIQQAAPVGPEDPPETPPREPSIPQLRYRFETTDHWSWDTAAFDVVSAPGGDPDVRFIRFWFRDEVRCYPLSEIVSGSLRAYEPRTPPPPAPDLSAFFEY